jgi:2,3-bisphosphoglycerate-dependent phosphoglycerate mutase
VSVDLVFETHSLTVDNEAGRATGWLPGDLSRAGRVFAAELGLRHAEAVYAAVFSSDLRRAVETVEIAFGASARPVLFDWRLRECNYGSMSGGAASEMRDQKRVWLDRPYPNGESWRQAVERGGWFLRDVAQRYDGMRILVIGHVATKWALDHYLREVPLEALVEAPFEWQEGWTYNLSSEILDVQV